MSVADDLQKLAAMKADGVLTDAEFQQAKSRLLQGDPPPNPATPAGPPVPTLAHTADKFYRLRVKGGAYATVLIITLFVISAVIFMLKD